MILDQKVYLAKLGWSDLVTQRTRHKAIKMYKIVNEAAPAYLTDKFSKDKASFHYNLRNSD